MLNTLICASLIAAQLTTGSLSPVDNSSNTVTYDSSYIIHASGEIDAHYMTNSREALRNSYADGNRYIEIDFGFTQDLVPVCIHDWNEVILPEVKDKRAVTYDTFINGKIYGKFTPMTLEDVAAFMTLHPDLYVITDVKDYNIYFSKIIAANHPELMDRFIIQVYSEDEYMDISNLGFDKIIFTLYTLDWETKTNPEYLVAFSRQNPLFGFTFPHELCQIEGYVETMLQAEIPLFVHTVNDKELQQKYFDMGISGIYTDNTKHN